MSSPTEPFDEDGVFIDLDELSDENGTYDETMLKYAESLGTHSLMSHMERTRYLKSLLAPRIYHPAANDNWFGGEALMVKAIKNRDLPTLRVLWEHLPRTPGAHIAAISALRVAVDINNKEATEMFLEEGVDPRCVGRLPYEENLSESEYFAFPLYNAALKGHLEILKLLMQYKADFMQFHPVGHFQAWATTWDLWKKVVAEPCMKLNIAVYLLLDAPRVLVAPTNLGTRIFFDAVQNGNTQAVRFLYIHHEEINKKLATKLSNRNNGSHSLCIYNHRGHVHDFTNCRWPQNQTALHLVASSYQKEEKSSHTVPMAQFLLVNGTSVHATNSAGKTALHIAVLSGDCGLVGSLLDHEADIDAVDIHGYTALHCAVLAERLSMVKLLLERGAAVDIADSSGRTPLNMALVREDEAIEALLISHRANERLVDLRPLNFELPKNDIGSVVKGSI